MVRKIKDSKKDSAKIKDIYETKREKDWDERFIYNKLENNQEKRQIPYKAKNDYSSNIKYLKEQFNSDNIKKSNNKTRGKSGYKIHLDKNPNINKNKIKVKTNPIIKNNTNNIIMNRNDLINKLNNTEDNLPKNSFKQMSKSNYSLDNNNNNNNIEINFYSNSTNNNKNKYYSMPINELEICVELFWNNLGVKEIYSNRFNKHKNGIMNEEAQKEFLVMEAENLENLENFLKTMQSHIENREKTILLLKKLIEVIEKQFISLNLEIRDNILNDFFQALSAYRINTVKVVEYIEAFRQIFTHAINKGKFHERVLMKKFGLLDEECVSRYKGNYLLKVINDINFLKKSRVNGYKNLNLKFGNNDDPFLLNVSEVIPISKDYYPRIKQGQYIIMQEIIYEQINSDTINNDIDNILNINVNRSNKKQNLKEINNNNNQNGINLNNNYNKYSLKEKEKISCVDKSNMKSLNDSNNRPKKTEKIVIETQLIDRNNYEKFFGTNDIIEETSEEQTLLDLKKGYDYIHNFGKNKKTKNEENIKDKKEKENKKDFENKKNSDIKNLKDNLNNSLKELLSEKKENEDKDKEQEKQDNVNLNEEIREKKIEKIEENNHNKDLIEEKIENGINNDVDKIEVKSENKNNNSQIESKNEEQEKIITNKEKEENKFSINAVPKKINNIIPEEVVKEEISIDPQKSNIIEEIKNSQEIEPQKKLEDKDNNDDLVNIQEKNNNDNINIINENEIKNIDNNIESNSLANSQIRKKLDKSRSLTPKSQRESKYSKLKEKNVLNPDEINKDNNQSNTDIFNHENIKSNDYMEFYCGKLSNFLTIYSNYYNNIPQEQKTIFNIKSNPLDYIHNNFYPKIIIYGDKKMKNIKGLCIISHIYWKKNELYIEHISAYNNDEKEKIFEMFLSFIKENAFEILGCDNNVKENDIYIDLYYKCEEGKFSINEGIRDYFRNGLKFKWVKLENISKYERYMKMRHHFLINSGNNNDLLNNENDDNNILNQSILGKKEFNNESNNNATDEEDEESNEDDTNPNFDISNAFELYKDKIDNLNNNSKKEGNNLYKNKNPNFLNNFSIKNKTVLKFNNKSYETKNISNKNIKYSNPLNFIYLLNKIYRNQNTNHNLYESISANIKSYFTENDAEKMKQALQKYINIKTNLLVENANYYSDIEALNKEIKNKFKLNVNINAIPPFDNCISFIYNGYHYNRIQVPKLEIFKERLTQQIFYMISKNENHAVLISSDLNKSFIEKYINKESKDNISINFMNVYNNLSSVNTIDSNILYIPAFEIKCKLLNNCNDKIPPCKKYNLYCYEDFYNIKYLTEELTLERNIKKNKIKKNSKKIWSFEYDLIKDEQINQQTFIKDNFLLIVFDLNLMEQIRDFPLLTLYVTKKNFIKKE